MTHSGIVFVLWAFDEVEIPYYYPRTAHGFVYKCELHEESRLPWLIVRSIHCCQGARLTTVSRREARCDGELSHLNISASEAVGSPVQEYTSPLANRIKSNTLIILRAHDLRSNRVRTDRKFGFLYTNYGVG